MLYIFLHRIRGIDHWIRESATGPLLSARGTKSCINQGIGVHFLHKIRGIGHWIPESATGPLSSARGIGHFKMTTFSRLSGT